MGSSQDEMPLAHGSPIADPPITENRCLVFVYLFGEMRLHYLFVDAVQQPQDFVEALRRTFRTCCSERSRILSSGLLLKKPVVSTFQISELPLPAADLGLDHTIVLLQSTIDNILTEALIRPSSLAGMGRDSFFAHYRDIVTTDAAAPKRAILIHLEHNPTMLRAFRTAASLIAIVISATLQCVL
ncbi:hypothetical protein HYQ45_007917 [Verticillium longisporum]|uniref:Uncharacterized protein n=1 Tax=Verticillium longisporum TaxID=100787 RepID=A0A8I2ZL93_VERLO|nr:hypothetical protein HYQ44_012863 [Verticillium longisporum]KAG7134102.1 hypothetical protein HYQ45_007917 [Verticillium longisporum]KAG7151868.1 hypothetical protein HYQ46_012327 [Verticillium longisporum]